MYDAFNKLSAVVQVDDENKGDDEKLREIL